MIKEIILPDLGEGIDAAEVSEVTVSVGDFINPDDTILVLESEKASMEIPADVTGTVQEVAVQPGDEITTGQLLFKIELALATGEMKKTTPVGAEPGLEPERHPRGKLLMNYPHHYLWGKQHQRGIFLPVLVCGVYPGNLVSVYTRLRVLVLRVVLPRMIYTITLKLDWL